MLRSLHGGRSFLTLPNGERQPSASSPTQQLMRLYGGNKSYVQTNPKHLSMLAEPPIITLLTDFGLKDPYAAEMKAVILSLCPSARMIDISHLIEKFNIRMGAFILASATPYFPKGTIHVAVVDPGVGTKRRALLVETEKAFYVGPDNGLLMLAAQKQKIKHIFNITNKRFMLSKVSQTFHGRDIFAPAAAYLANGVKPTEFGAEIKDYCNPEFAKAKIGKDELIGQILHVDDFGNIITNISHEDLDRLGVTAGSSLKIRFGKRTEQIRFVSAYGEVKTKAALALVGSSDFFEIAINKGNASRRFGVKTGTSVSITSSR